MLRDAGHGDYDHHESVLTQILEAFGIGRGVLGLASNQALHPVLRFPAVYVWLSALISLVGTSLIARGASGVVARYLQMGQIASMSRERLIGATGVAVFTIDETSGVADVYDAVGTVHRVTCHTREGSALLLSARPSWSQTTRSQRADTSWRRTRLQITLSIGRCRYDGVLFVLIGALLIFAPIYLGWAWTQTLVSSIVGVVVMFLPRSPWRSSGSISSPRRTLPTCARAGAARTC